jgi:hypothetical protein
VGWDSPLAATTGLLYQPQVIDEGDCGAIGGMKIGRGNRSTRRKPTPTPLCLPQIPHDQARARTRAAAVGSQRLTAWAMARPLVGRYPTIHGSYLCWGIGYRDIFRIFLRFSRQSTSYAFMTTLSSFIHHSATCTINTAPFNKLHSQFSCLFERWCWRCSFHDFQPPPNNHLNLCTRILKMRHTRTVRCISAGEP